MREIILEIRVRTVEIKLASIENLLLYYTPINNTAARCMTLLENVNKTMWTAVDEQKKFKFKFYENAIHNKIVSAVSPNRKLETP